MSASEERIYKLKMDGLKSAGLAYKLLDKKERIVSICTLCDNIVNALISSISALFFVKILGKDETVKFLILSGMFSIFIFIFGESIPKTIGIRIADTLILSFASIINLIDKLTYPILFCINKFNDFIMKLFNIKVEHDKAHEANQSILGAVEMYYKKGAIVHEDKKMLNGVLNLDKYDISAAMTHKSDIYSVSFADPFDKIRERVLNSKYSKIPVFDEKYDEVLGIITIRDFLRALVENKESEFDVKNIMKKPYFIPEGASIKSQLPVFKKQGSKMGVIVDEYGSVIGIVTMEDIVEKIIGEVQDENDNDTNFIQIAENTFVIEGETSINEFNEHFASNLVEDGYSTISGMITNKLERIPASGEKYVNDRFEFTVLKMQNNKISKIKVYITKTEEENE